MDHNITETPLFLINNFQLHSVIDHQSKNLSKLSLKVLCALEPRDTVKPVSLSFLKKLAKNKFFLFILGNFAYRLKSLKETSHISFWV